MHTHFSATHAHANESEKKTRAIPSLHTHTDMTHKKTRTEQPPVVVEQRD